MKIKAVMIDFDGTLGNTNEAIIKSFQSTYKEFLGYEEEASVIKSFFGEPLIVTMKKVFGEEKGEAAASYYRNFQKDNLLGMIEVFPGMDELVKKLKAEGYKVALVTSRVKESVYQLLDKFRIRQYFDVITTINDITRHKPDPESVNVTLEALGISPEEAVLIGDSRFDILCAKNAGCASILVDWSVTGEDERIQLNADYIAKDAEDIFRWINENYNN